MHYWYILYKLAHSYRSQREKKKKCDDAPGHQLLCPPLVYIYRIFYCPESFEYVATLLFLLPLEPPITRKLYYFYPKYISRTKSSPVKSQLRVLSSSLLLRITLRPFFFY